MLSIKSKVNDSNEYSELHGKLTWSNKYQNFLNHGVWKGLWHFNPHWSKNDLDLTFEERLVGDAKVFAFVM